jgi:hypothetical protein
LENYEKNFSAQWFPEGAASSSSDEKLGILNGEKFVLIHLSSLQCEVHRVENCSGFAPTTAPASNVSNHVILAQKNRFSVRSLQTWELTFETDLSDLIEEKGIFTCI